MRRLLADTPAALAPVVLALALGLALPATAQQPATPSQQDRAFALEAAKGGMVEIQMGKLAQDKGQDPRVRRFGQRMVDDHSEANQQLMAAVRGLDFELPSTLDAEHQERMRDLQALSGARFDQRYMTEMVEDHEKDVRAFDRQAAQGQNPELRSFAQRTLPVLRRHLDMARSIHASLQGQAGAHGAGQPRSAENPGKR